MSVLIKGMEMPKGCLNCLFKDVGMSTMTQCMLVAGWVKYVDDGYGIPNGCPLVEVPTPHGRLIDADKVIHEMNEMHVAGATFVVAVEYVKLINSDAPTVIEAEDE